jgi:hypothetical protein
VSLEDLLLLSKNHDFLEPWLEDSISLIHCLEVSARLNQPLAEIFSRLKAFAVLGFEVPNEDDMSCLAAFTVSMEDLIVLSKDLDGLAPWLEGCVSADHIVRAAEKLNESEEEARRRFERFAPRLGMSLEVEAEAINQACQPEKNLNTSPTQLAEVTLGNLAVITVPSPDQYSPFEHGIKKLLQLLDQKLGREHISYSEALTYQHRYRENINTSRLHGDTEERKATRSEIIHNLNNLANSTVGRSFNELCEEN